MKALATLVVLVACGEVNKTVDAPPGSIDAPADADVDAPSVSACDSPTMGSTFRLREVIPNVGGAALLATAPTGDDRVFVVVQSGTIRIIEANEAFRPQPFLDLTGTVVAGGEQGLLGLAFHPQYASNGQFFVYYTRLEPGDLTNRIRDVVARCVRDPNDANVADPASCVEVLAIPDFASNHNGGMIEFGPDNLLYIATGDGGSANDPNNNGQALTDGVPEPNTRALLGKILRIDVDNKDPGREYGIPNDNPFAGGGGLPEIFVIGLRNPWRWSFDRGTGDMWIGDVGQNQVEEIHVVRPAQQRGANLGWRQYEGSTCFMGGPCDPNGKLFPQDERLRGATGWDAIIGGQVYRGACYPDLVGTYFYADHGTGDYAKATLETDGTLTVTDLAPPVGEQFPRNPASIHESGLGELYLTTTQGRVYRVEAEL